MKRYLQHIIHSTEKRVDHFLLKQVRDKNRRDFGGMESQIFEVKPTIYVMTEAVSVYVNPESRYYKDEKLYESMNQALDFIAYSQREDGSFDYPSCNFKSAPDTSFCFKRLIGAYRLLVKYDSDNRTKQLMEKYRAIIQKTFPILLEGGFHTPNHRWAITAALLQCANLVKGDPIAEDLLRRANLYLAEGIDINEDGEYAERSAGNYNAVVNNSMMTLYEESGNDTYLACIEKNLRMMLYYFDPDDTIFTQNSTRQDQGRLDYPDKYFYQYLYLAAKTGDSLFDAAAHKIIKDNMDRGRMAPECLHIIMLYNYLQNYEFQGYGFLDTYQKVFKESGIARVKTSRFSYSILRGNRAFVFMKFYDTPIYLKIGESYSHIRNFIPQTMENTGRQFNLSSHEYGWYYQPFENYSGTSDWWKMDHSKRQITNSSELILNVMIKELEDGLEFTVETQGLDRLPLRVEICIPSGSILENEHFYMHASKGEEMILRDGYIKLHCNDQKLLIGPGYGRHEFSGHYSGEEKNENGFTIYFNDYTPYNRTFSIRLAEEA